MQDIDRVPHPDEPSVWAPFCRHLRCKGMYVSAEHLADTNAMFYDATIYWCALTFKSLGPDSYPCHATECLAGRGCFVPTDPT